MKRNKPLATVRYSPDEEPIFLSKPILDLLLKQLRFSDLLGLYVFYYRTAKYQGTKQPWATTQFASEGMKWGIDKTKIIKKNLKDLGLIEDVVRRDIKGQIVGHYIKVNLVCTRRVVAPLVVKSTYKYSINPLKRNTEKNIIPPTIKMVTEYCSQRKNKVNPQTFIDFYESKGWLIGKNRMKDWQAAVRTWEQKDIQGKNKFQPDFKYFDGMKYVLSPDGKYRHCKTGDLLIE